MLLFQQKNVSFVFFFSFSFADLPPTFSFSLSFSCKFVDMTINLLGRVKHVVHLYPSFNFFFSNRQKKMIWTQKVAIKRSGVTFKTKGNTQVDLELYLLLQVAIFVFCIWMTFPLYFYRVCAPINHQIVVCKCIKLSRFLYRQETKRLV